MRSHLQRVVISAETQVFAGRIRVDNFVRIHLAVGIPQRLELAERLHQLRAKHFWEQSAARLAVSVFSGKRSAITQHQIRGAVDEFQVFADARFTKQVEIHLHVNASVPEMAVKMC